MTSEQSRGKSLHAPPLSPTASSESPAILTPLSTSPPSDHSSDPARRRPSPNPLAAQEARGALHEAEDEAHPSTALLADAEGPPSHSDDDEEQHAARDKEDDRSDDGADDDDEMAPERPPMHRPTGGRSEVPLLKDEAGERGRSQYESPEGSARPAFAARRSTFRSRSPDFDAKTATRRKYMYASFFLLVSLVSFVVQTETASYIQIQLGWNKAYCML